MAKKPVVKPETKLNERELRLLSQVLYQARWNGTEWQKTITPLINKLARIIDEQTNPSSRKSKD